MPKLFRHDLPLVCQLTSKTFGTLYSLEISFVNRNDNTGSFENFFYLGTTFSNVRFTLIACKASIEWNRQVLYKKLIRTCQLYQMMRSKWRFEKAEQISSSCKTLMWNCPIGNSSCLFQFWDSIEMPLLIGAPFICDIKMLSECKTLV